MKRVLLAILCLGMVLSYVAGAATNFDTAGTVKSIRGSALAVQNAQVRPLKIGDKVFIGDILSTGHESRLEIAMVDDGNFKLGASTSFVVIDYTFGQGNENNAVLELLNGAMDGVSGGIAKANPDGMKVLTRQATIGIRGTKFFVGEIDGRLSVAHWSGGGVHVKNHGGEVFMDKHNVGTHIDHDHSAPTPHAPWHGELKERAKAMVN